MASRTLADTITVLISMGWRNLPSIGTMYKEEFLVGKKMILGKAKRASGSTADNEILV